MQGPTAGLSSAGQFVLTCLIEGNPERGYNAVPEAGEQQGTLKVHLGCVHPSGEETQFDYLHLRLIFSAALPAFLSPLYSRILIIFNGPMAGN